LYESDQGEALVAVADRAVQPARGALLARAARHAAAAAAAHPRNPQAYELLGSSLLLLADSDPSALPDALASFETASRLDPTHAFPVRGRIEAARRLSDAAALARAEADLRRLEAAEAEGRARTDPAWTRPSRSQGF
jgi:hypothetical protein